MSSVNHGVAELSLLQSWDEASLDKVFKQIWLTVISSSHPQTAAAIENHFKLDTGNALEDVSASLGFRSTEALLLSDLLSHLIVPTIVKDELNEHGIQKFYGVSFDDISHITNLMSESALSEEQKESRKQYFKETKYSKLEYKEKAIEMREKIAKVVHEYLEENSTNEISWEKIQEGYLKKYGQQLIKKHFHEAFPTGHPSKLIENYMRDEYILKHHEVNTGSLIIQFRRPYHEILEIFKEARAALHNTQTVIKPLEFRSRDNVYVDYVRERTRKEVYLQNKEAAEANRQNYFQPQQNMGNNLQQTFVAERVDYGKEPPKNGYLQKNVAVVTPQIEEKEAEFPRAEADIFVQPPQQSMEEYLLDPIVQERHARLPKPRLCYRY